MCADGDRGAGPSLPTGRENRPLGLWTRLPPQRMIVASGESADWAAPAPCSPGEAPARSASCLYRQPVRRFLLLGVGMAASPRHKRGRPSGALSVPCRGLPPGWCPVAGVRACRPQGRLKLLATATSSPFGSPGPRVGAPATPAEHGRRRLRRLSCREMNSSKVALGTCGTGNRTRLAS